MQVVVSGLVANYSRTGKGKQIIVLPGWADTIASWQAFARELSKHYDVIALDLPGFGGSQVPREAWSLNEYAAFLKAFIAKLELEPYAIVGHSNGGGIAIRGIASKLFVPTKLVLLASAGIRGEYNGRNKALRLATKTGKLLSAPLPGRLKKKLRRKVYETVGSDMLVAEQLQETFKNVITDDVRADAAKLKLPVLLVYGDRDEQTPVRFGQQFHELIKGSKLEILPGADHFLFIGDQAKVLNLTEDFLA